MTPQPAPNDVLKLAAELRAAGSGWDAMARAVGLATDELRRICDCSEFEKLEAVARREVMREALAEATGFLRTQLRSEDSRTAARAADCLARVALAFARARERVLKKIKPDERLKDVPRKCLEMARQTAIQSDEELLALALRQRVELT